MSTPHPNKTNGSVRMKGDGEKYIRNIDNEGICIVVTFLWYPYASIVEVT